MVLMGYYLLPEHYLLSYHPHEHDPHCCSIHLENEGTIISPVPQHCPEKENYKLVYDIQPKFFDGFTPLNDFFDQVYTPEKIKAISPFLSKPRAPPGLV
jgi:hypothetical protein